MKHILFSILLCTAIAGCGLFTPRTDFEDPLTEQVSVDHFNFADLLAGSSQQFTKLDWYELFDNGFKYINVRLTNHEYGKETFVNHLLQQRDIYPHAQVSWRNNADILERGKDTLILNKVTYTVMSDTTQFSGSSIFTVIRGTKNFWCIVKWIDEPDAVPFFSPAE